MQTATAPAACPLSHYDLAEPIDQDAATAQALASVTGADLIDQLFDVGDVLVQLVRAGQADKAGAVVAAVCKGYAARLGMRDFSNEVADRMPDSMQLAAGVLAGVPA